MHLHIPSQSPQTCGRTIPWPKANDHAQALLAAVRRAHAKGQTKKADYLTRRYLNSYAARLVATKAASNALAPYRRPLKSKLPEIAASLTAWRGTDEKVAVWFKPKETDSNQFRTLMNFGIENRALQYLVLEVLKARTNVHPSQFAIQGGTHAAIKAACDALLSGYRWVVEIDISNCYSSFDGELLSGLLPVPKEVVEKVILSHDLNLYPDKHTAIHIFGVDDDFDEDDLIFAEDIVAARRGIPQGSAVSPLVAEWLLAPVLTTMPSCGIVLNYADNFLVMAKEESEAVSMQKTLCCALTAHPAGPLLPNEPKRYMPGESVEFLGHALAVEHSTCRVEPSPENLWKFKTTFAKRLKRIKANGISASLRRIRLMELRQSICGWSENFRLWKGAVQHREEHAAIIKETAASLGILGW